jgi:hypothetical protein
MGGSCQNGNEPSGAIKDRSLPDQMSDHLFRKDSTLRNYQLAIPVAVYELPQELCCK